MKTPLVEPIEGEGNDIYCASLLWWRNKNLIVCQDQLDRGGAVAIAAVCGRGRANPSPSSITTDHIFVVRELPASAGTE